MVGTTEFVHGTVLVAGTIDAVLVPVTYLAVVALKVFGALDATPAMTHLGVVALVVLLALAGERVPWFVRFGG